MSGFKSESDLALRETILGILKSKDSKGNNKIHSSDFRVAITDLGFPMGSPVVENILVYCKLENDGMLDFSELERELVHERRISNAQKKPVELSAPATSSGIAPKPWRSDIIHESKINSERQLLLVTEHAARIRDLFSQYDHHNISPKDVLDGLQILGIQPTKEFMKILQQMTIAEVSYSDFIRTLTKFDPNRNDLADANILAGGFTTKPTLHGETIGSQRKRTSTSAQTAFYETKDIDVKPRTYRKMVNTGPVNDQIIFKAAAIRETLFFDESPVPMLSHNQTDMIKGTLDKSNKHNILIGDDVQLNIEEKLKREQVLAALRKLDNNKISMDDFHSMLYSIGIELDEGLTAEIKRAFVAGRMDIRKYMKYLDANVFKVNAVDEHIQEKEEMERLIQKLQLIFQKQGINSLNELAIYFRKMDSNKDEVLTFTEFKDGFNSKQITPNYSNNNKENLNDKELRVLFHHFDRNGDGVIQYEEFLQIFNSLPINSPQRIHLIKKAFQKLDRHNEFSISIDRFGESCNFEFHPLVLQGKATHRDVLNSLVQWFSALPGFNGNVSYEAFEQYFMNLSTCITSNETFTSLMNDIFGLTKADPAPPLFKRKNGKDTETPMAIQHHGNIISWTQDSSYLEDTDQTNENNKGIKVKIY